MRWKVEIQKSTYKTVEVDAPSSGVAVAKVGKKLKENEMVVRIEKKWKP